ncbi:MAG: hypothetical protein Q9162_001343 [Coniocarpon cinnabarinum]
MSDKQETKRRKLNQDVDTKRSRHDANDCSTDSQKCESVGSTFAKAIKPQNYAERDVDGVPNHNDDENGHDQIYYKDEEEQLSRHLVFDESWNGVVKHLQDIAHEASRIFDGKGDTRYHQELKEKLDRVNEFPKLEQQRIALVGHSGTGKSSLINSLTGIAGLADISSTGGACTNVTVEFTRPFEAQAKRYKAEISFHDASDLENFLRGLVDDARYPLDDPDTNIMLGDPDGFLNNAARRRQADIAFEMLHGLMRADRPFRSRVAFRSFLCLQPTGISSGDGPVYKSIVDTILTQVKTVMICLPKDSTGLTVSQEADHVTGLSNALEVYTRIFDSNKPQLWPLVDRIKIGVQDCRLLEYMTFTDLPELISGNWLRDNVAQKHFANCSIAWVICDISRVKTNYSVHEQITKLQYRFGNVVLVCTFADKMATESTFKSLKSQVDEQTVRLIEQSINEEKRDVKEIREHVNQLRNMLASPEPLTNFKEELQNARQQEQHLYRQKEQNELNFMRIGVKSVRSAMKEKFPGVPFFAVSNKLYHDRRYKDPEEHLHTLPLEYTGIADVRRYSLVELGERIYKAYELYQQNAMKPFLDYVCEHFVEAETTRNGISDLRLGGMKSCIDEYINDNRQLFRSHVVKTILNKKSKIISSALERSKVWEANPFSMASYRMFARNRGSWKTSRIPAQDWNKQIVASIASIIAEIWDTYRDAQRNLKTALVDNLQSRLQHDVPTFQVMDGHKSSSIVQDFKDTVLAEYEQLKNVVELDFDKLQDIDNRLRRRLEGFGPDAYILLYLLDTYNSIATCGGKGAKCRMQALMRAKLENRCANSFVDDITANAVRDLAAAREIHRKDMLCNVDSIVKNITDKYTVLKDSFSDEDGCKGIRDARKFLDLTASPKMKEVNNLVKKMCVQLG